jgi:uncharacterized protein (DUF302 family)
MNPVSPQHAEGILTRPSPYSAAETLRRLEAEIAGRGLTVFARFDHAAAARSVGLEMPDASVLVFGNPKAGTPVMVASPLIAIELPLRVLMWSDAARGVFVSFTDPGYLASRYGVPDDRAGNIGAVGVIVEAALR